jgi:acetolactate synthase I/II/III large subunit
VSPKPTVTSRALSTEPAPTTGARAIWDTLARLGVTHVFGYPGGAILPTYDVMPATGITHVLVRHEQSAAHMADGFARATGRVGVAMATSGPGATNLVTGIATAMLDGSPIVCITGQVHSSVLGTDAFQEIDITGITMPITKHNFLVTEASEVAPALFQAFEIATSGRPGPVLVDITKDAQQGGCDAFDPEPSFIGGVRLQPDVRGGAGSSALASACAEATDAIRAAKRPLILAGHGVVIAGASRLLREFAERGSIPVATTLLGIGAMPASHPLCLGMLGMHGEAFVNQAVQEADLIIGIGMRFDDRAVGRVSDFAPRARRIHIDIDRAEIGKTVRADIAIAADAAEVLRILLRDVPAFDRAEWLSTIATARRQGAARDILNLPDDGRLHAAHVMRDLWRQTRGRALVVTDVGQNQMWEAQYHPHDRPRSLITSGGLGTMGFGLPAAIGAKMARPEAEVWVVAGDGGFQMTSSELATVAEQQLPLRIALINNGYLGMVRQWQELFYGSRYTATPMAGPDFCKLAEAYGLAALRVEDRAGVVPALRRARREPGPVLIEFRVEPEDVVYPIVPSGSGLQEMIRRPLPGPKPVDGKSARPRPAAAGPKGAS